MNNPDIVISDIATAMVLVRIKQKEEERNKIKENPDAVDLLKRPVTLVANTTKHEKKKSSMGNILKESSGSQIRKDSSGPPFMNTRTVKHFQRGDKAKSMRMDLESDFALMEDLNRYAPYAEGVLLRRRKRVQCIIHYPYYYYLIFIGVI